MIRLLSTLLFAIWPLLSFADAAPAPTRDASAAASTSSPASASSTISVGEARYVLVPVGPPKSTAEKDQPWYLELATALTPWAWPLVALVIVLRVLRDPKIEVFLARQFPRISQLSVYGLEIKLSEGAAATVDDVRKLVRQVPETHKDWVSSSHLSTQFQGVIADIKQYLTTAECDCGKQLASTDFGEFRFTLHVPDVLLANSFRQLVNYIGAARGGSGRLFSTRMGIIGKAWRSGQSEYVANASAFSEEDLIERWGMTRAEAQDTSSGKKIFIAVLIASEHGIPVAVLYGDARSSLLFDRARCVVASGSLTDQEVFRRVADKVLAICKAKGLTASLEALESARTKVQQIDFYQAQGT